MTAESAPIFDAALMLAYLNGEREIAAVMLGSLLADFPQRLVALETALDADELATACREAHTLKGFARGGGAKFLADLAYSIEMATRNGDAASARATLPALKATGDLVMAEWRQFLQNEGA